MKYPSVEHEASAEPAVSAGAAKACQTPLMRERLLELLRRGWLTPLQALQQAGCLSLSQRVGEFKRAGIRIEDAWVALPNGKRVKQYRAVA
jgi:hypothetical protein